MNKVKYILIGLFVFPMISISSQEYDVVWKNLVGMSFDQPSNTLTKTAANGWTNAGALSENKLKKNADGYIKYSVEDITINRFIGLSTENSNPSFYQVDYGFFQYQNWLYIIEHGRIRGYYGRVNVGDEIIVEREGNRINYKKNDVILRHRNTDPDFALFADVSVYNQNGTITGLKTSFPVNIKIQIAKTHVSCDDNIKGTIDATITGGVPPYSVLWDNGVTTEDLQNLEPGAYKITVTDAVGLEKTKSVRIFADITWQDEVNTSISGDVLTKTGTQNSWDAGARSSNILPAGQDGRVEYTITESNQFKAIGLSADDPDQNITGIDHAIVLLSGRRLIVLENGVFAGFRRYKVGDAIKIIRKGNKIRYKLNNTLIHKTTVDNQQELFVDVSIRTVGASISGIEVDFCPPKEGPILNEYKLSDLTAGFGGVLHASSNFGVSSCTIDDLDGDGINEMVFGASFDNLNGLKSGAVYIVYFNADLTVKSYNKITEGVNGFNLPIDPEDHFGVGVANIGDFDRDGVTDIAISAHESNDNGSLYITLLNPDGTVKDVQKISDTEGDWINDLQTGDKFANNVTALGDVDGDGVTDLAVGVPRDDDGAANRGSVFILFMNPNGTVKSHQKISSAAGGMETELYGTTTSFGWDLETIEDLDGDGINELVVGADRLDGKGGYYTLFLNANGTVRSFTKVNYLTAGLTLDDNDYFGTSISMINDLNNDGIRDLLVGAFADDDGGADRGAVYLIEMTASGDAGNITKISSDEGGLNGPVDDGDRFGMSVSYAGDLLGTQTPFIAIGATLDDDGGTNFGANYLLELDGIIPGKLTATATVTNAIINQNGTIDLSIQGGTPPYQVYWGIDGHLNIYQFNQIKNTKAGFLTEAGLPQDILNSVSYSDFQNHFSSSLRTDLEPGLHRVFVYDSKGNKTFLRLSVSTDLQVQKNTGLVVNGDVISKADGSSGWGTYIESANHIGAAENSYLEVLVDNLTSNYTFGLKEAETVSENIAYDDINFGFLVDANRIYILEDGALTDVGTIKAGDQLGIEKNQEEVNYTKNGVALKSSTGATGVYQTKTNINTVGSSLNLTTKAGGTIPKVKVQIDHVECGSQQTGEVSITALSSTPYTIQLTDASGAVVGTTSNVTGLAAGVYTLSVTNSVGTYQTEVWVGHKTLWTNQNDVQSLPVPNQNSLLPTTTGFGTAVSNNQLPTTDEGWQWYQLEDQNLYSYFDNGVVRFQNATNHFGGITTLDFGANFKLNFLVEFNGAPSFQFMGITNYLTNYSIERAANGTLGYWAQNASNTTPIAYQTGSINLTGDLTVLAGIKGFPGILLKDHLSSFSCIYPDNAFLLQEKLTGGYYQMYNSTLRFDYQERYEVETGKQLQYRIFDEQRNLVAGVDETGAPLVGNSPSYGVQYGFNVCELDLTNLGLANGNYLLEVTTPKNDKTYLRFKL